MANFHDPVADVLRAIQAEIVMTVGGASGRLSAQAEELHRKLGRDDLRVPTPAPPSEELEEILTRVRESLRDGRSATVRPRDAKAAARCFSRLGPKLTKLLLAVQPAAWGRFVDELFRSRISISADHWKEWATILAEGPRDLRVFAGPIRRDHLLLSDHVESAQEVVRHLDGPTTLKELDAAICADGPLSRTWPYTSLVFSKFVELHSERWPNFWEEVTSEVLLEAMLLPHRHKGSWFRNTSEDDFPLAIPENVSAQVLFAASCLSSHFNQRTVQESYLDALLKVLAHAWRDPRTLWNGTQRVQQPGWKDLQEVAPQTYQLLMERLLAEDLKFFFDSMNFDQRRMAYWRRHLKSMVASSFYLSRATVDLLRQRFPSGTPMHEKAERALNRARILNGTARLDALILFFRHGVAVEFSQEGNAAYCYTHENYAEVTRRMGPYPAIPLLKSRSLGEAWVHRDAWEMEFDRHLSRIT